MRSFARFSVVCLIACYTQLAFAQATLPAGFSQQNVARPDGQAWAEVVGLAFTSSGRLFAWERGGSVWIIDATSPTSTRFLDLRDEVAAYRDHGMLGFALHPDFDNTGHVYALYVVERHHLVNCDSPPNGPPICGPGYVAGTHTPFNATIARIVRYSALLPPGETTYHRAVAVDPNSRKVLYGESFWVADPQQLDPTKPRNTGCPVLHESHSVGSLVFGQDGTLLASCGDGASYLGADVGSLSHTYYIQALADGIISPRENIGAYRSQLVNSFSGKIIRINPSTGDGISSNPFFDASSPRSARSRTWALGFRNPFRFTVRPGTGSHNPLDGDPGILYVGDVGMNYAEELNIVRPGGLNFGWPYFEGHDQQPNPYWNINVENQDALNPLFNGSSCTRRYFYFGELIKQDTLGTPSWPNPCNASAQITSSDVFLHARPQLDWLQQQVSARFPAFNGNDPVAQQIGTTAPDGSRVLGAPFSGNSSTGGAWYTGTSFPAEYQNTYFHGDYGGAWIKNFVFNTNSVLQEVRGFGGNLGGVVAIAMNPQTGELYYVAWAAFVRRIGYAPTANLPPIAVATASTTYGASPLNVLFSGAQSSDPNGDSLTYTWDFGDGSPLGNGVSVSHVYSSATLTNYDASLIVSDPGGLTHSSTLLVSVNNTPPTVDITSPVNGTLYSLTAPTVFPLTAILSDAQSSPAALSCVWQTILHHNNHTHQEPPTAGCSGSMIVSPIGCDGETYFFEARLTVTDPHGLSTQQSSFVYPSCQAPPPDVTPPTVTAQSPASGATGVATGTVVTATFSEPLDAATVTTTTFELRNPSNALIAAAVSYNATTRVATLTPNAALAAGTTYTATLRGGATDPRIKDIAGNALAANSAWSFTTVTVDTTPPTVTAQSPASGATGVATGTAVTATFSEPLDAATVTTTTFELRNPSNALIAAAVSYNATTRVATLTPNAALAAGTTYTATLRGGATDPRIKDIAGNALAANSAWSFTAVAVSPPDPGADALVAAYSFDEGAGITVVDVSGNGHAGAVSNALWSTVGQFGGSMSFDGAGDWVTIADHAALDFTTGMTLQAWVRPAQLSGWRTVLLKEAPSALAYGLYAHDNAPRPAAYVNVAGDKAAVGAVQLPLNAWTHLAATFDGTTLSLYVNGTQVGTRAASGAILSSTGSLRIGGNNIWGEYFTGLIDEVRLHNRALTQVEIQSLMSIPVGMERPGFEILAYNDTISIGRLDSGTYNFDLTPLGGFTAPTTLAVSGLPLGVTASFQPPTGPPHPGPFSLTVSTSATTPIGSFQPVVTVTSLDGTLTATKTVTLNVTGEPNFAVSAEPNSLIVSQGLSGVASLLVQAQNGFAQSVTMSAVGLPANVTASFTPASLFPTAAGSVQFNVGSLAVPGTYPVQISATDGIITRQAAFSLTVLQQNSAGSWRQLPLGDTPASFYGVVVGDIGNTGQERVIASAGDGIVYEYRFDGTAWSFLQMPFFEVGDGQMHNMAIGPGRNDGVNRLYIAAALSGRVYELSWSNGAWQTAIVAAPAGSTDVVIGDGRNDGVMRMYVSWMSGTTEFTRVGNTWQQVTMSSDETGWVHGIDMGQPQNDGLNRIVTANQSNGDLYSYFWNGITWVKSLIDASGTDSRNIEVGEGRNDGLLRIYVASGDGNSYEYTWTGSSWQRVTIGNNGINGVKVHAIPARAKGDGIVRIYVAAADGAAYEYNWTGSAWQSTRLGAATAYMYGLATGNALGKAYVQVYGSSYDGQAYLFEWVPTLTVVPSVVGQTQAAATAAITTAGLVLGTVTQQASASVPAGSVISQNPSAGANVAPGSAVSIVVSTGPAPVPVLVPDVVGQTQAAATAAITGAGLVLGTVTQQASASVPAGSVISQNPLAGASVATGSAVSIVVSTGPAPAPVLVPDVVGQTQAAATAAITGAGLVLGTVTQQSSASVPAGSVISQNPLADTRVAIGSAVSIVVSTGPAPVPVVVPDVVGQTQAAATAAITGAGLVLGTVTQQASASVPAGSVISQNPLAGASVATGSAVSIVVSTGPADTTPPTVTARTPASGATGVATGTAVTATFSEPLDAATVTTATFELRNPSNALIAAAVSYNATTRVATLTPSAPLAANSTYTVTVRGGPSDPSIKDLAGNRLFGSAIWTFTTSTCPCSIWGATAVPAILADSDTASVQLGVKFRSSIAGFITGIRYYKSTQNTGTHVGSLWTAGGALLASVTFTNETGSGWQQASFATPVAITANTVYVASYRAPNGRYSANNNFFTATGVNNGPLRALQNGESGGNGVYVYSTATTFPTLTWQASNYWVDVVFDTGAIPDTTPPTVAARTPAPGATGVATGTAVTATFSEPLDATTVTTTTFVLRGPGTTLVPAAVSYNSASASASLVPGSPLVTGTTYTATLAGGASGIKDLAGNALATDSSWSFATVPAPVVVPNVVGQTQAAATAAITGAGLALGTVTQQASASVPAGSVISQSPSAGASVSAGSAVSIVVSTGPAPVVVPNVVGQTQAAATTAITGAGLALGTVTQQASASVPAGSVISQSPSAGASVSAGSAVSIVVSTGPVPVVVPNVVGQTQAAATTAITGAGLVLGTVTQQASASVPAGSVISQNPLAGASVATGSAVNIVVSTGPPPAPVVVPNVVGQTQAAATTAITGAGLVLGTVTQQSSASVPAGSVISQNPLAGASVATGSAVSIVVSTGPADTTPPTVTAQSPVSGASGVATGTAVTATFSEPLNAATVTTATFVLRGPGTTLVPATVSYNSTSGIATLLPGSALTAGIAYTATLTGGASGIKDLAGNPLAANSSWSFTTAPFACPCSIWGATAVPAILADSDTASVQLGVKFRSSIAGFITGIRYYKSTQNTGTHVGNLWTAGGVLLASVTFTNETGSGWQQANFATPVAITANTVYVASYRAPNGRYSANNNFFATTGVNNGPLRALQNGESGGNGVYVYSTATTFPTLTWQTSNYWVDVVFTQ